MHVRFFRHHSYLPPSAANRFGAITPIPKNTPAPVKKRTTAVASAFAQRGLTTPFISSRSFTSMKRNTSAGGIARTAITFTTSTTRTNVCVSVCRISMPPLCSGLHLAVSANSLHGRRTRLAAPGFTISPGMGTTWKIGLFSNRSRSIPKTPKPSAPTMNPS